MRATLALDNKTKVILFKFYSHSFCFNTPIVKIGKTFNDKNDNLNLDILHLHNTTHCVVMRKQNL